MKAMKSRVLYFPIVAITIGLIASCSNGDDVLGNTDNLKWKDVVSWNHSWDAVDATTYLDHGKNFDLPEAVRVDSVFDPSGGLVMSRDDLARGRILGYSPLPGTLFQPSNSMFGGRPSWFSDTIVPHDPTKPTYAYSLQSSLSPVQDPWGAHDTFFDWPQPWWGAVLVRGVGPFEGHNQAYIDGNPGMVTISRSPKGTVMIRSWTGNNALGEAIDSGVAYEEETVLVMWLANGKKSWLEVNYRDADGRLVAARVVGEIGDRKMDDFHTGFSHTNYTSAIGIAKGIPTTDQTDAVRNWAAAFIPEPAMLDRGIAVSGDSWSYGNTDTQ
jgi:hypothetical protein